MKHAGYLKTARTWRKSKGNCICITNLQACWTNKDREGSFTINLGVYFPKAEKLGHGHPPVERPYVSDCIVNERLGVLMPSGLDHWWEIKRRTDLEKLGREVAVCWQKYGHPWLEKYSDPYEAQKFLKKKKLYLYLSTNLKY